MEGLRRGRPPVHAPTTGRRAAYTKSLRDQIDSLKATRAHDKLKIDGLESRLARYREALTQALTWEGRLNKAEQLGMQKRHPEAFAIKAAVAEEMKTARALASTDTEGGA